MSQENERKHLILDAHLDISINALEWNRDQCWTVEEIRRRRIIFSCPELLFP